MSITRKETQEGLAEYIQQRLNDGQRPSICGGDGGDGQHYMLPIAGGIWGRGEVYIRFTNHGYCDKPSDFDPYLDSIDVSAY